MGDQDQLPQWGELRKLVIPPKNRLIFLSQRAQGAKVEVIIIVGWRRKWHPTPVLLPGKSHRWRSLVGCSPWGLEELDTTGRLHFHFSLSCIGEGNVLAWRIPGMEEPGGLPSMGLHRVGHN